MALKKPGTLDRAIEAVKRQKLQEASAAGCASVTEFGRYLGVERTRAYRLMKDFGYIRSVTWRQRNGRRKTPAS